MASIKMIVSNIEDTMVHHEPRIPLYIRHLNKGLKDAGIILSYFTGKMPCSFQDLRDDIGPTSDVVYAHGGYFAEGNINHAFNALPLMNMVVQALQNGVYVSVQFDNLEQKLWCCDEAAVNTPEFWGHPVYRVKFYNPLHNGFLRQLEESCGSLLNDYLVSRNKQTSLEITSPKNNKGEAIKFLAQKHGLSPDEILVIGACEHDIPVFEWVKHSVAVGNAHYKLKAKAGYVTDADYDSGYVEAINLYFPEIVKAAKVNSDSTLDWYD